MIKIVTIDLDGTLFNSKKEITFENKIAIAKCHDLGVKIVIATGRPISGVMPVLEELGLTSTSDYAIIYNGSKIINVGTGETISVSSIDGAIIKKLYAESKRLGVFIHAYKENGDLITPLMNPYTEVEVTINRLDYNIVDFNTIKDDDKFIKCLFTGSNEDITRIMPLVNKEFYTNYSMVRSSKIFLEFLKKGIEKGSALKSLASYLNIKMEDTMAIGDAGNDIPMIAAAGIGVAMKNSFPEVFPHANYITKNDNNNSGVAEALNKFIIYNR